MKISSRLKLIASFVDDNSHVIDVGCDHALLDIFLVQTKTNIKVIASDVNKGPLERAREHVSEKRLSTYIETRLSDGAKAINYIKDEDGISKLEVQAALIAGMGGRLMIRILQDSLDKFTSMDEFILQPQSEIPKVRQFIREIGYHIEKENMILEDGKYYPMMKVVRGKANEVSLEGISQTVADSLDESGILLQELFDEYGECLLKEQNETLYQFLKEIEADRNK